MTNSLSLCTCVLFIGYSLGCNHSSFPEDALVLPGEQARDSNIAAAELLLPLKGTMSKVLSGDTFEMESQSKGSVTIRIYGIDTPERGQPYDERATARLTELLANRSLVVDMVGTDEQGNTIGETLADGERVAQTLLDLGLAWHDSRNSGDPELANSQESARSSGIGIWGGRRPNSALAMA